MEWGCELWIDKNTLKLFIIFYKPISVKYLRLFDIYNLIQNFKTWFNLLNLQTYLQLYPITNMDLGEVSIWGGIQTWLFFIIFKKMSHMIPRPIYST